MTHTANRLPREACPKRRGTGSFISALVGWTALNLFASVYALMHPNANQSWWYGLDFFSIYSAGFIFSVWLVLLLPLYLLIPSRSFLWRWPVCTICGTVAGALIMLAITSFDHPERPPDAEDRTFVLLAASTGAITCLFGSLTARGFEYDLAA